MAPASSMPAPAAPQMSGRSPEFGAYTVSAMAAPRERTTNQIGAAADRGNSIGATDALTRRRLRGAQVQVR